MFCQTFLNIKAHTVQYFFINMMTEAKLLMNLLAKREEKERIKRKEKERRAHPVAYRQKCGPDL